MWVIESVLGHHPVLKIVFFSLTWMASLIPLPNQRSLSRTPPGCLQRSVHFLSGVGVLLNLVQRKRHVCVGPFVNGWAA